MLKSNIYFKKTIINIINKAVSKRAGKPAVAKKLNSGTSLDIKGYTFKKIFL